jgi:mannosyl-oligosaccharide alpha-1,2-mannosidase
MSNAAKAQVDAETPWGEPEGYDGTEGRGESTKARDGTSLDDILERRAPAPVQQKDVDAALSTRKPDAAKSQFPIGADGSDSEWDCVPQGFVPGGFGYQTYHMGGGQDSAYEYFGKVSFLKIEKFFT